MTVSAVLLQCNGRETSAGDSGAMVTLVAFWVANGGSLVVSADGREGTRVEGREEISPVSS